MFQGQIPFNKKGDMMNEVRYYYQQKDVVWRDNHEFNAIMTLTDMYSGRSAKGVILTDQLGNEYQMFVVLLVKAIQDGAVFERGKCQGRWCFAKRGANYSVEYVGQQEVPPLA